MVSRTKDRPPPVPSPPRRGDRRRPVVRNGHARRWRIAGTRNDRATRAPRHRPLTGDRSRIIPERTDGRYLASSRLRLRTGRSASVPLGEPEHEHQHAQQEERPPQPHHPPGIIPHPLIARSRFGERFYTRPASSETASPTPAGSVPFRESDPRPTHRIGLRRRPGGPPCPGIGRPPSHPIPGRPGPGSRRVQSHHVGRSRLWTIRPLCSARDLCHALPIGAGWSRLAARRAHNPKVGGSNPPPATTCQDRRSALRGVGFFACARRCPFEAVAESPPIGAARLHSSLSAISPHLPQRIGPGGEFEPRRQLHQTTPIYYLVHNIKILRRKSQTRQAWHDKISARPPRHPFRSARGPTRRQRCTAAPDSPASGADATSARSFRPRATTTLRTVSSVGLRSPERAL